MEKQLKLTPLAEVGKGTATVSENSVSIRISGVSGGLKAWLIGGEALPIGNIVDGRLHKNVNTKNHSGILITQSGRQMFIGRFGEDANETEQTPFDTMGFNWRKVTEKSFKETDGYIRFLLSNKKVYANYKKYRHYFIGESETGGAIALRYDETDECPFEFPKSKRLYKNGYAIVCIDKKTGKIYLPNSF